MYHVCIYYTTAHSNSELFVTTTSALLQASCSSSVLPRLRFLWITVAGDDLSCIRHVISRTRTTASLQTSFLLPPQQQQLKIRREEADVLISGGGWTQLVDQNVGRKIHTQTRRRRQQRGWFVADVRYTWRQSSACVKARTEQRNTPFTGSSKHRANIKHWQAGLMEPRPWLKCKPRLSPQLITCYTGLSITTRPPS